MRPPERQVAARRKERRQEHHARLVGLADQRKNSDGSGQRDPRDAERTCDHCEPGVAATVSKGLHALDIGIAHCPIEADAEASPAGQLALKAGWHDVGVGYPNATRMSGLLAEICKERGWCIGPEETEVRVAVEAGADAVVDMLIRIEMQMEPVMLDKETRRWLRGRVVDWLFDPCGRGASSGLPL